MNISPLKVLNFATFLQYQRFVMPISFLFYLYNGLNFSDFILFQSIFNITCLITKIPMGVIGDMFSKKYILIFSYFLFLLRVILWISFSGFWIILCGEILYGLFKALYRGNVDSYIYEWLKTQNIEKNILPDYGRLSFYTSLGSAISCLLGAGLYKFFGFKILLYLELVMQIIAISALFLLPNIKTCKKKSNSLNVIKDLRKNIVSIIQNTKINFYVFYSAILTGLTNILVWNFQPLLKASGTPIIFYGIINFTNQILRGAGGLGAKKVIKELGELWFTKIQYFAFLLSFSLLLCAILIKNFIFSICVLTFISVAICIFVMFNIFAIAKVHENTPDYIRATTSSTNTFFGDFMSFILLLSFKFLFDKFGLSISITIFLIIFAIILYPTKMIYQKR